MKFIISNPQENFYQRQCDWCKAIFIYQGEDTEIKQSKRNEGFYRSVIKCPCCNIDLLHVGSKKI